VGFARERPLEPRGGLLYAAGDVATSLLARPEEDPEDILPVSISDAPTRA
jgi:hypothetical protein